MHCLLSEELTNQWWPGTRPDRPVSKELGHCSKLERSLRICELQFDFSSILPTILMNWIYANSFSELEKVVNERKASDRSDWSESLRDDSLWHSLRNYLAIDIDNILVAMDYRLISFDMLFVRRLGAQCLPLICNIAINIINITNVNTGNNAPMQTPDHSVDHLWPFLTTTDQYWPVAMTGPDRTRLI